MRIRGLRRLKKGWAKLRGLLNPGPTVLLWHRVAHLSQDLHLLTVTPTHFEEQLLALRQHHQVVSLAELKQRMARGMPLGPLVVLTFDDGYADNATTAIPLLKKYGLPATFYLSSGFVGTSREYPQDAVERLLWLSPKCPDELDVTIGGKRFVWTLDSRDGEGPTAASAGGWNITSKIDPTPRHRAHREIHRLLTISPQAQQERVLDQLRSQCGDPGPARPSHRAMSWDEARDMAACELVELGAHTVNHPLLSALSLQEQRCEILDSKRVLEAQIGRPVTSFAYPYGSRESYTTETIAVLKQLDFTNACTTQYERIGAYTDPFQLPRIVVRDWDGDEFLRSLRSRRR